ncbi:MAG: hypothetical protein WC588_01020 [Candidatus Micrarchaeia archaeon]
MHYSSNRAILSIDFGTAGAARSQFYYDGNGKKSLFFEFESDLVALKALHLSASAFSPKIAWARRVNYKRRPLNDIVFDFGCGRKIVATVAYNPKDPRFAHLELLQIGPLFFEKPTLGEIQGALVAFFAGLAREAHARKKTSKGEAVSPGFGKPEPDKAEMPPILPLTAGESALPRGKWVRADKEPGQEDRRDKMRFPNSRQRMMMR